MFHAEHPRKSSVERGTRPTGRRSGRGRYTGRMFAALLLVFTAIVTIVENPLRPASTSSAAEPGETIELERLFYGPYDDRPGHNEALYRPRAAALNDHGFVAGSAVAEGAGVGITRAIRWAPDGTLVDLTENRSGELADIDVSWLSTRATDINNDGVVVGTIDTVWDGGFEDVFVWTEGGGMERINLPVEANALGPDVHINAAGGIVSQDRDGAHLLGPTGTHRVIPELASDRAWVNGINVHMDLTGWVETSPDVREGFRWTEDGGLEILDTGSQDVNPVGITDDGVIGGHLSLDLGVPDGLSEQGFFRWTEESGTRYLGGMQIQDNGLFGAHATAMNNEGRIVGLDRAQRTVGDIITWHENGGFEHVPYQRWDYWPPVDINMRGDIVTDSMLIHGTPAVRDAFDGSIFRVDGLAPFTRVGESVQVRLRVGNTSGRMLTGVALTDVRVEPLENGQVVDPDEWEGLGAASLRRTSTLAPTTLGTTGVDSQAFADFELTGVAEGEVRLVAEVEGVVDGERVTGTIERDFTIRINELNVELELDPADFVIGDEGSDEPVEIAVTYRFTNTTPDDLTDVRLESLWPRTPYQGQHEVDIERVSGMHPDIIEPEVLVPRLGPGETSEDFEAVFRLGHPAPMDFVAVGSAVRGGTHNVFKTTTAKWRPEVTKFVEVRTEMVTPQVGELIPAGEDVVIDGTVENLTSDYEVTLGPLWPEVAGNVGEMSLAYNDQAPDPADAVPVEPFELAPGEILRFQVRFSTAYSDSGPDGPVASGGTRAIAVFEPWGHAEQLWNPDEDGAPERVEIRTYDEARPSTPQQVGEEPDAQVLTDTADLHRVISVDDSVEMPAREWWRLGTAAAIGRGGITGAVNMVIATIRALPDLVGFAVKAPGMLVELSAKVWDSFEEWERDEFTRSVSFLVVSVLLRSAEFSYEAAGDLYDAVDEMTAEFLDKNMQDFYAGDFEGAVENMTAVGSEAILSVLAPVALSKLAKSPKVAAKLDQWQTSVNAEAALLGEAVQGFRVVQDALPMLRAIRSGAEPTFEMIKKLWGISQREIAEYQRICKEIGCIATVRSRHASSLEWIQKWKAVLKPERLKIKSVSDLDVFLGYDVDDIGSLIFRKPEILTDVPLPDTQAARKAFLKNDANVAMLESKAEQFVRSKGLQPGQPGYDEAVKRLGNRTEEWIKHELDYKKMHDRKWIDVDFNYGDNMIPEYKFDAAGNIVGDLSQAEKVKTRGFELERRRIGEQGVTTEEYVVKMQDQSGRYRRITGDIDPVDFTYVDGSPLSGVDLARLTHELQNSFLGAEHGYTATFRGYFDPITGKWSPKPGPELVLKQFKPGEAGLQIKPDAPSRAVRLNVERSQWNSPRDYRLQWDGGHTDIGMTHPRGTPRPLDLSFDEMQALPGVNLPLPVRADPFVPTLGRMVVEVGTAAGEVGLIIGTNGQLQKVLADGTTEDTDLHDEVFAEGPVQTLQMSPQSQLLEAIEGTGPAGAAVPGPLPAPMAGPGTRSKPLRLSAGARQAPAPDTRIVIDTGDGFVTGDFEAGQVIAVGVGTDGVETRKVVAIGDGWLQVDTPFVRDHDAGEIVMMTVAADGTPVNIDDDADRTSEPTPDGSGDGDVDGDGTSEPTPDGSGDGPVGVTDGSAGSGDGDVVAAQPRADHDGALPATGTRAGQLIPLGIALVFLGVVFTAVTTRRPRRRRT